MRVVQWGTCNTSLTMRCSFWIHVCGCNWWWGFSDVDVKFQNAFWLRIMLDHCAAKYYSFLGLHLICASKHHEWHFGNCQIPFGSLLLIHPYICWLKLREDIDIDDTEIPAFRVDVKGCRFCGSNLSLTYSYSREDMEKDVPGHSTNVLNWSISDGLWAILLHYHALFLLLIATSILSFKMRQ